MIDHVISQGITGLICIDLWEQDPYKDPYKQVYLDWLQSLATTLKQHQWATIINAGYHTRLDYQDRSIFNTLLEYNWKNFDQEIMLETIRNAHNTVMCRAVQDMFDQRSFALYSVESFLRHQRRFAPDVKRWLVVGAAWQVCVHGRDLGLDKLMEHLPETDLEFYGTTWGFFKRNAPVHDIDFRHDHRVQWQLTAPGLYQAQGKRLLGEKYEMV